MKLPPIALVVLVIVVGGCPSDPGNPETLWLGLDGSELKVKLIDHEPTPF